MAQYLDPGAGSTLIQVVVAIAAGLAAGMRLYWKRISSWLSRFRKRSANR
jgi:hypothetical protein